MKPARQATSPRLVLTEDVGHVVERRTLDGPIVVGAGVAGLTVALGLDRAHVLALADGSTAWAQGGIAAAVGAGDRPADHARDTHAVAGGLAVARAVEVVTTGGPDAIAALVELGADFDRDASGRLRLGREAGHGRRRIIHADGDTTGAEVQRALWTAVTASPTVHVHAGWRMLDLLRDDTGVTGVLAVGPDGRRVALAAPGVVLATGGIGQLYRYTTNPPVVTGDGLAAAARVGAHLADLEFVQFHPTALAVGRDPMPLLTEALRGEGAWLVDDDGHRFMLDVHPDAELAPRDVVARATFRQRRDDRGAWLDARHLLDVTSRFPTIAGHAAQAGLDPQVDLLPVSPAAHYFMGGIATDDLGRTSVPGLWAVGEVSSTGLHGANRLASNSLLEGLVIGARVAQDLGATPVRVRAGGWTPGLEDLPMDHVPEVEVVRAAMWDHVGIERDAIGLSAARAVVEANRAALDKTTAGRVAAEVALLVIDAARGRRESRGAHHRIDHPDLDPAAAHRRVVVPTARPTTTR